MLPMNLASLSKNPWMRRGVGCVIGILLAWVFCWALVPPLLKHLIASRGSEALGRQVSVAEVDFRPWSLELTLRDLVIRTLDGDAEQLAVERLYIDMELQSLVRLAPVLDALVIEAELQAAVLRACSEAGWRDRFAAVEWPRGQ